MAPPRFAPTGRRLQPRDPGGLGRVPIIRAGSGRVPIIRAGTGQVPVIRSGAGYQGGDDVGGFWGFLREHTVLGHGRYKPAVSTLGAIARVLGVGENVAVGTLQSAVKVGSTIDSPLDVGWALVSPWTYVAAYQAEHDGEAFTEVAQSVRENETYMDWINESQKPGSFLYENAMVIGLGLAIFGDPTTYLSFGATTTSKIAAQRLLVASLNSSADEALTAVKTGIIARTGEAVGKGDYELAFRRIHTAANRPSSPGDAMRLLNEADKGKLPDLSPEWEEILGIGSRRGVVGKAAGKAGEATRPMLARGGQGIRFMGAEIPGTIGLGGKIGRGLQRIPGVPTRQGSLETLDAFIPNAKLLRVHEDGVRAVSLAEFTRVNQARAMAQFNAADEVLSLFALEKEAAKNWMGLSALARARLAVANIFDKVPMAVPKADRRGLLAPGFSPKGKYKDRLIEIRKQALKTRDEAIARAEDLGFDKGDIEGLHKLWDDYIRFSDDPVDVLYKWNVNVEGRLAVREAMEGLLRNPLIARPRVEGAEDLLKFEDELSEINTKLARATKRVKEKGISPRALTARKQVVADLQQRSQEVAARWKRVSAEMEEKIAELPAAVRTREEFEKIFDETAMPMTWKGVEYWVPAPIHQALQELRNPTYVDKEIRRFFRMMNFTQNKWKIAATSLMPRFWVMNMVGGIWNNLMGGIYNPGDYMEQFVANMRIRLARADDAKRSVRALGPMKGRINPDKLDYDEAVLNATDSRGVMGGFVAEEVRTRAGMQRGVAEVKPGYRRAFTAGRRTYAGATFTTMLAPDAWIPDELEDNPIFNPIAAGALLLPEFARGGMAVTSEVETLLRATPMRVATRDRHLYQAMEAMSVMPPVNFGQWMNKVPIGQTEYAREVVWDIGAAMALKFQFDYTNLKPAERYIAKTIFPFYVFNKNNFILQAQQLVERPRFVATAMDIGNFMNYTTENEQNAAYQAFLPEYFDKLQMFRVPVPGFMREALGIPEDQDVYINPNLPYASLNMFPPLWEIFNDNSITPGTQRLMQQFAPFFGLVGPFSPVPFPGMKPAIEYSVGYNLGLARPIDYQSMQSGGWRNSQREVPSWMKYVPGPLQDLFGVHKNPETGVMEMDANMRYIADQMATPFMNAGGDVFNWGTGETLESDRIKANAFSFITGVRLTPVDPLRLQRGWLYRYENFLESRKANAKQGKDVQFGPADELFLKRIRVQLKAVERAWDAHQKALYGEK